MYCTSTYHAGYSDTWPQCHTGFPVIEFYIQVDLDCRTLYDYAPFQSHTYNLAVNPLLAAKSFPMFAHIVMVNLYSFRPLKRGFVIDISLEEISKETLQFFFICFYIGNSPCHRGIIDSSMYQIFLCYKSGLHGPASFLRTTSSLHVCEWMWVNLT